MPGVKFTDSKGSLQVRNPKKAGRLGKDLKSKKKFEEFAKDPKKFAAKYGLVIDARINQRLKRALVGKKSLAEFQRERPAPATAAAIAVGHAVPVTTKLAVAF